MASEEEQMATIQAYQAFLNSFTYFKTLTSIYNFGVPFILSLVLYLVTWNIAKSKKFKKFNILTHNAIWNTVLLIALLPSVVFGFYLVLRYPFPEIEIDNFNFLLWHVEGSIVMGTVVVLHLIQRFVLYVGQLKSINIKKSKVA